MSNYYKKFAISEYFKLDSTAEDSLSLLKFQGANFGKPIIIIMPSLHNIRELSGCFQNGNGKATI